MLSVVDILLVQNLYRDRICTSLLCSRPRPPQPPSQRILFLSILWLSPKRKVWTKISPSFRRSPRHGFASALALTLAGARTTKSYKLVAKGIPSQPPTVCIYIPYNTYTYYLSLPRPAHHHIWPRQTYSLFLDKHLSAKMDAAQLLANSLSGSKLFPLGAVWILS